jgi:acetoin utilization protein AcuC
MNPATAVTVYQGAALASYNFGAQHPFGPQRHDAFVEKFEQLGLQQLTRVLAPVLGTEAQLLSFHTAEYVTKVKMLSKLGHGLLDCGDTPAFPGVYEAALTVVGTTLDGVQRIMQGETRRVFNPIGGLHHARRDSAAGFCVFNDCGIAIELLRKQYGVKRIAYVDIDAHHGDGVFYSFIDDVDLCFADIHEDGQYLYPGSGSADETGEGAAHGTKLNIPMPPGAGDAEFMREWQRVERFVTQTKPEFILLQAGADSLGGDPITHLRYTSKAHAHAAQQLCRLADKIGHGRVLVMGGGGYDLNNLANAWCAVVRALVDSVASPA